MRQFSNYLLCLAIQLLLQGLVFILNPSLEQIQFHRTLLFLSDYSHIHSTAVLGSLGTQILQKNCEDQGFGARAEDHLPLGSVNGRFFWGYKRMLKIPWSWLCGRNFFIAPLSSPITWYIFYHLQSLFRISSGLHKSDQIQAHIARRPSL